jgi:putative phosphoribosyl transferase
VVIVDDGLATGSTARVACRFTRAAGARRIVLAVPVGARSSLASLATDADEVVAVVVPERFYAVGQWYDDFTQTTDDEVARALQHASQ